MFTLKVSWNERVDDEVQPCSDNATPCRHDEAAWHAVERTFWLSDVRTVERLSSGIYRTTEDIVDKHGDGVRVFADVRYGRDAEVSARERAMVLLLVHTGHGDDYQMMLVERAWLMSDTGATIDRLAP